MSDADGDAGAGDAAPTWAVDSANGRPAAPERDDKQLRRDVTSTESRYQRESRRVKE